MAGRGACIVIEGADGATADAQFQLLREQLAQNGQRVLALQFPRPNEPAGYFVQRYLQGDYGTEKHVGPYTGSMLYALDHFDAADGIRQALEADGVVLIHRFTAANMATQGIKFHDANERRGFYVWLDNLEFEVLKLPRPDLNIVLRGEPGSDDATQSLADIYDDLCQLFPKDFSRIDTSRNRKQIDQAALHKILMEKVRPLLPKSTTPMQPATLATPNADTGIRQHLPFDQRAGRPAAMTASSQSSASGQSAYIVPEQFDPATAKAYSQAMDEALEARQALEAELIQRAGVSRDDSNKIIDSVRPVASFGGRATELLNRPLPDRVAQLANQHLPAAYATGTDKPLRLTQVLPRNEFEILPAVLYAHSDQPLADLQASIEAWPYALKADVLAAAYGTGQQNLAALDKMQYSWEITSSFGAMADMVGLNIITDYDWQTLTPRQGFDVPKVIEDAGLADSFEECFEASLRLYSLLQQNGYAGQAVLAVLAGHRLRWQMTVNGRQLTRLLDSYAEPTTAGTARHEAARLTAAMRDKLHEIHPLLFDSLNSRG